MVVGQFLVPLVFTTLALVVAKTFPGPQDSPALEMSLAPYGYTAVPYSLPPNASLLLQSLAETFKEQLDERYVESQEVIGKIQDCSSLSYDLVSLLFIERHDNLYDGQV